VSWFHGSSVGTNSRSRTHRYAKDFLVRRPEYTDATLPDDIRVGGWVWYSDGRGALLQGPYKKLTCECGAVVYVVRQASQCAACAKAKKAAHMREVRSYAPSKEKDNFGKCPCGTDLYGGRITQRYCSDACRQKAYRKRHVVEPPPS
jgi:hypothetical protein